MLTSQLADTVAAQEQDDGSDMDYESVDDEDMEDASTLTADQPPAKKQKQKK